MCVGGVVGGRWPAVGGRWPVVGGRWCWLANVDRQSYRTRIGVSLLLCEARHVIGPVCSNRTNVLAVFQALSANIRYLKLCS